MKKTNQSFTLILTAALFFWIIAAFGQGQPLKKDKTFRILFVGNSLTYANNLPKLVEEEAKRKGLTVETKMIAKPNYAIVDHWAEGKVQEQIKSKSYDFVVIQQGPSSQTDGYQMLVNDAKVYTELCGKNNTKLAYFMVWPAQYHTHNFDGVIANYTAGAKANQAILCPVGKVWKQHFEATQDFSYYSADQFHPSLKGSMVAAEVIVESLFKKTTLPNKTESHDIQILDNGLILIPSTFYGNETATGYFIFDTGAGIHAISSDFYKKISPKDTLHDKLSIFTGFRHNGERLDLKTTKIDSISSFDITEKQPTIAIYEELNGSGIDGIIGLKWIENNTISIDFKNKRLALLSKETLKENVITGEVIPFTVKDDRDISLSMFLKLQVNVETVAEVEFDTGTPFDNILLNSRYLNLFSLKEPIETTKNESTIGIDKLVLDGYSGTLLSPTVTFKDMIYDGLIGAAFFKEKKLTIDMTNKRLIINDAE